MELALHRTISELLGLLAMTPVRSLKCWLAGIGVSASGSGEDNANRNGNAREWGGGGVIVKNRPETEKGTPAEIETIEGRDGPEDNTVCGKWTGTGMCGGETKR